MSSSDSDNSEEPVNKPPEVQWFEEFFRYIDRSNINREYKEFIKLSVEELGRIAVERSRKIDDLEQEKLLCTCFRDTINGADNMNISVDDITQAVAGAQMAERPRVFNGLPKESIGWLEDFTYIADSNGWDDKKRIIKLGAYLTGSARAWFTLEIYNKVLTWEQVVEKFYKQFLPVNYETYVRNELRQRKQQMYESSANYICVMRNLLLKCNKNMKEEDAVDVVLRGFQPQLAQYIIPFNPRTFAELQERANLVERSLRTTQEGHNDDAVMALTLGVNNLSMGNKTVGQSLPRMNQNYSRTRRGGPKCFKCGRSGHVRANCYSNTSRAGVTGIKCYKCQRFGHIAAECRMGSGRGNRGNSFRSRGRGFRGRNNFQRVNVVNDQIIEENDEQVSVITTVGGSMLVADVKIDNLKAKCLLDTGASITLMSSDFARKNKYALQLWKGEGYRLANGAMYKPDGQVKVKLEIVLEGETRSCSLNIFVASGLPTDVLMGYNIIQKLGIIIDGANNAAYFNKMATEFLGLIKNEAEVNDMSNWGHVYAVENIVIPAKRSRVIEVAFQYKKSVKDGEYLLHREFNSDLLIPNCLLSVKDGMACCVATNVDNKDNVLIGGTKVGSYENTQGFKLTEVDMDDVETNESSDLKSEYRTPEPADCIEEMIIGDYKIKVGKQLTNDQKNKLKEFIMNYTDVIAFDGRLGTTDLIEYEIDIQGNKPVHVPPYRCSPAQRDAMQAQAKEMERQGVIEPCKSPWSSPIIIVRKPDGTFRFVTDFRQVNKLTKNWVYEIPLASDCFRALAGSKYFSTLDANSGFWQIKVKEEHRDITAFIVPGLGSYRYIKMPMGATCSPQHFQCLMDKVLGSMKYKEALAFIDDVIVIGFTFEIHLINLGKVLTALRKGGITLKPTKCIIAAPCVRYLGHVVDESGTYVDNRKVDAIAKMSAPVTVKEVRQFLGKCGYYRNYIENYAEISKPLCELMKENVEFKWSNNEKRAFNELKSRLCTTPVLVHYDEHADTELRTDASLVGIGAILYQLQRNNKWHPIEYASRLLNDAEKRYTVTEQECLAVVYGLNKFRQYLVGMKFKLVTDHIAIKWLMTKKILPGRLSRWAIIVSEYTSMEIVHRPGKNMADVDYLSRHPVEKKPETEFDGITDKLVLSVDFDPSFAITQDEYKDEQNRDERIIELKDLMNGLTETETHVLRDNLMYRKKDGEYLLEIPDCLIRRVLYMHHDHPIAGHGGFDRTLNRLKERFYFPNMRDITKNYIESCADCLSRKKAGGRPYGLMQPMQIMGPGEKWSLDFLGSFPTTDNGKKWIIVGIDNFTKYVEIKATRDSTANTVVKFLINRIVVRHGVPRFVVSDRGKCFMSRIFNTMTNRIGITHLRSTAFHPQVNLAERVNASISSMLSMYVDANHRNWDKQLSCITLAINTHFHRSIGTNPFYMMYGRKCVLPGDIPVMENDEITQRNLWENTKDWAKQNIREMQEKNKQYYDKKHQDKQFNIGDVVMLYTPNRRVGKSSKLDHYYKGPYTIVAVRTPLVYELNIGRGRTDVVHVSRLKAWKPRYELGLIQPEANNRAVSIKKLKFNKITQIIFTLFMILNLAHEVTMFTRSDPLIWVPTDKYVINKVQSYQFSVTMPKLCDGIFVYEEQKLLKNWCYETYKTSITEPLKMMCAYGLIRNKRAVPIIIAVGGAIAVAGGIIVANEIRTARQIEKLKKEVDEIRRLVFAGQDVNRQIKKTLQLFGEQMEISELDRLAKNGQLRSDVTIAVYLANELAKLELILREGVSKWRSGSVHDQMLNVLGVTLPCGTVCPIDKVKPISCTFNENDKLLWIQLNAKELDLNFQIMRANIFTIYDVEDDLRCQFNYIGMKYLIYDTKHDCAIQVGKRLIEDNDYISGNYKCENWNIDNKFWIKEKCLMKQNVMVQVKLGTQANYVYCPGHDIVLNGVLHECPIYPIKLPVETNFKLLNFTYNADSVKVNVLDDRLSTKVNYLLEYTSTEYKANLDNIFKEIDKIDTNGYEKMLLTVHEMPAYVILIILLMLIVMIVVMSVSCYCYMKYRMRVKSLDGWDDDVDNDIPQLVPNIPTLAWSPLAVQDIMERMVDAERVRLEEVAGDMEAETTTPISLARTFVANECERIKEDLKAKSSIGGIPRDLFADKSDFMTIALDSKKCFTCKEILRDPRLCVHCFEYYCKTCINSAIEGSGVCFAQSRRAAKCVTRVPQRVVTDFLEILEIECSLCNQIIRYPLYEEHAKACARSCDKCGMWNNGRDHNCVDELQSFVEQMKLSFIEEKRKNRLLEMHVNAGNRRISELETEVANLRGQVNRLGREREQASITRSTTPSTNRSNTPPLRQELVGDIDLVGNDMFDSGSRTVRAGEFLGTLEIRYGLLTRRFRNVRRDITWNQLRANICEEFDVNPENFDLLDVCYRLRKGVRTIGGELFHPLHRLNLVPRANLRFPQNFLWSPPR